MSLHYILDGYNIIKSENTQIFSGMTLQSQRQRLIYLIEENRPQGSRRNKVTVVFDGTYENSFWGGENISGVDIVFSAGETADRKIEELVFNSANPSSIIVVSDDKGLWRFVKNSGAKVMKVSEFFKRLFKSAANFTAHDKLEDKPEPTAETNEEFLKEWRK